MKERFVVGTVDSFPEGSHPIVEVGGRLIGIYNVNGSYFAIQNTCPHALAPICMASVGGTFMPSGPGVFDYGMNGRVLRCPWHGWEFDIATGEALFGIDRRRLATFPVYVEDGKVVVIMRSRSASDARGGSVESATGPSEVH
jgi:nitrite reductase/ring-hydroxylating ferredoxin subunit